MGPGHYPAPRARFRNQKKAKRSQENANKNKEREPKAIKWEPKRDQKGAKAFQNLFQKHVP